MSFIDKFVNAVRINNDEDYDEDEFYDEEDEEEEEDDFEEEKPKKSFFSRFKNKKKSEDDYDDEDEEEEEEYIAPKKKTSSVHTSDSRVTPINRKNGKNMQVRVIKPANMEDTRHIADTLLANCTVILNLEGLDVEIAQRVIDFSSGACYTINGSLQKVSSYIFVLTPRTVGVSGDITDILSGAVPSMRNL